MSAPSWLASTVFEVYSIGDAEMLHQAFNGLAMITGSSGFGNLIKLGLLVGLLGFGARALMTNRFEANVILSSLIMYICMFGPKVEVLVIDAYSGAVRPVSNVPIGLAAPFSLVSKTGRYFADTFETAFSVIGPGSKYVGAGYLDALQTLLRMRSGDLGTANSDNANTGNLTNSLYNYMVNCVQFDIELNDPAYSIINPNALQKTENFWGGLRTEFVNINTLVFSPGSTVGVSMSCADAYAEITNKYINNGSWRDNSLDSFLKTLMEKRLAGDMSAMNRLQGALDAVNLSSRRQRTLQSIRSCSITSVNLSLLAHRPAIP